MPPHFNHGLMELSREAIGLSQAALADAIDCTQATISRWEHGLFTPSEDELAKLCAVLRRPASFFAREDSPLSGGLPVFYHRALAAASAKNTAQVNAHCFIRALQLEKLCAMYPPVEHDLPHLPADHFKGGPAMVAAALRAKWAIGRGPIHNLVSLLEAKGGVVIVEDLGCDQVDALCWWRPGIPKLFFLNARQPSCRMRFSLAHEIGHTVMHIQPTDPAQAEAEADSFAGDFLMPGPEARATLQSPLPLARVAALKTWWKMSMAAIIQRAKESGAISSAESASLFREMGSRGWRKREPVEIDPEQPTRFAQMLRYPLDHLGWSLEELAEALFTTIDDLRSLLGNNLSMPNAATAQNNSAPSLRLVGHRTT